MLDSELMHRHYLGDGVYAGWDGYHIVLYLQEAGAYGPLAIALEPKVIGAFIKYRKYLHGE